MKPIVAILLAAIITNFLCGCGTIYTTARRCSDDPPAAAFPAIKTDMYFITRASSDDDLMHKIRIYTTAILWVPDLPFSLVTDTVLYPLDKYQEKRVYGRQRDE